MPARSYRSNRKQNLYFSLLLIVTCAAATVFMLSFLPWFEYLNPKPEKNPYDLVALEKMNDADREKTVNRWVEDFRGLSDEEKANRADQYIDAMVNFLDTKLDLHHGQKVETKSLIKGGVMVANQSGLREVKGPNRDESFKRLREQVRGQLDSILTPDQRTKLQGIVEERDRWRKGHNMGPQPGGSQP